MNKTKTRYRDWTISATCRKHSPHDISGPGRYTGHAIAVLTELENNHLWADSRPQTSDLVSQVYVSSGACLEVLVAQVKGLIDALGPQVPVAAFGIHARRAIPYIPAPTR